MFIAQQKHFIHMYLLVLSDLVGDIDPVRIARQSGDLRIELGVEESLVQIDRQNVAAIVGQTFRRERLSRPEQETCFGREFLARQARISLKRQVVDQRLWSLAYPKRDVKPRLTIDNVDIDFDIFITPILIKSSNTLNALMEQLGAELSAREEPPVALHCDLLKEFVLLDMLIALECNRIDPIAGTSVHFVNKVNVRIQVLEIRGYLDTKVALALKKIDQISPAL